MPGNGYQETSISLFLKWKGGAKCMWFTSFKFPLNFYLNGMSPNCFKSVYWNNG